MRHLLWIKDKGGLDPQSGIFTMTNDLLPDIIDAEKVKFILKNGDTVVGRCAIDQMERMIVLLHHEFESDLSTVEMSVTSSTSLEY